MAARGRGCAHGAHQLAPAPAWCGQLAEWRQECNIPEGVKPCTPFSALKFTDRVAGILDTIAADKLGPSTCGPETSFEKKKEFV